MLQVSAKTKAGIDKFWATIEAFRKDTSDQYNIKRSDQRVIWAWAHVQDGLRELILEDPRMKATTEQLITKVRLGEITPGAAADKILYTVLSLLKT